MSQPGAPWRGRRLARAAFALILVGLGVHLSTVAPALAQPHEAALSGPALKAHVRALAHDSLRGRLPGTPGGDRAAAYIARQLAAAGLEPALPDGGYLQQVPLIGTRVDHGTARASVRQRAGADEGETALGATDLIIRSQLRERRVVLDTEIVFAGHGIDAREHGWDDFGDFDLSGKWVAVVDGVPEAAAARLPGGQNSYHGEAEAKLRAVARRGAAGVLFLAEPGDSARFVRRRRVAIGQELIQARWDSGAPLAGIVEAAPAAVAGLMAAAGTSYDQLLRAAGGPGFRARALGIALGLAFEQRVREFQAPNVVGILPGREADAGALLLMAHYDALGVGPPDETGDSIFNGARDNASGTAALIQLAAVLSARDAPPRRTAVFLATTAEEADFDQIGARFFIEHPVVPIDGIAVALNIDGVNWRAPTADFVVFPAAGTDAYPTIVRLAEPLAMEPSTAPWHQGMHFSFDTKEFLARGIVGLTIWQGDRYRVEDPRNVPERLRRSSGIHAPSDEFQEDWSDEAIRQHLALYYAVLEHYAEGGEPPQLVEGNPFSPLRRGRED